MRIGVASSGRVLPVGKRTSRRWRQSGPLLSIAIRGARGRGAGKHAPSEKQTRAQRMTVRNPYAAIKVTPKMSFEKSMIGASLRLQLLKGQQFVDVVAEIVCPDFT